MLEPPSNNTKAPSSGTAPSISDNHHESSQQGQQKQEEMEKTLMTNHNNVMNNTDDEDRVAKSTDLSKSASYKSRNKTRYHPTTTTGGGQSLPTKHSNSTAAATTTTNRPSSEAGSNQSGNKKPGGRNRGGGDGACAPRCNISRTMMLRILLVVSLFTAAGVCAALAYMSLQSAELETAVQTYNSVAASALFNAKSIAIRKFQASEVTAALVSWANPNADDWPFIYVNGYIAITSKIADLAQSTTQATMIFVDPDQAEEFETHIQNVYQIEGRPETAGVSNFGFGIWKPDPNMTYEDGRLHDTTGEVRK
jgi:hypothetical protein